MTTLRARGLTRPLLKVAILSAAILAVAQVLSPALQVSADPPAANRDFPIKNKIDEFVLARLQQEKIEPSATCTDDEFIRRVYLDVAGVIPSSDAVKKFLSDRSTDKRAKLIDALLASDRYAEHFYIMWGDALREHSNSKPKEGTERGSYREWIQAALKSNMPYDKFARELITATGSPDENGAVNFFLRDENDRVETTNTVATVFMGSRMACAQCHDHPFDKWTQNDFHSIVAFFGRTAIAPDPIATLLKIEAEARLPEELKTFMKPYFEEAHEAAEKEKNHPADLNAGKKGNGMSMEMAGMMGKGRELLKEIDQKLSKEAAQRMKQVLQQNNVRQVREGGNNEYRMPGENDAGGKKGKNGGDVVKPEFPWDPSKKIEAGNARRKALADAVTGSHQFAAVQANRLWSRVMGRGIVDPIDDFREKNPPTHPELLDYLADEFIKAKFDNKAILRLILNSSTYQRSSKPTASNKADTTLYSHARLRRLTSEQLFDSILVATGRENGLEGLALDKESIAGKKGGGKPGLAKKTEPIEWACDLPTPARQGTFMNTFNQPTREQIVMVRDESGSIPQALELLNGSTLNNAVRSSPTIAEMLQAKTSAAEIVAEVYLSTLSRYPTPAEVHYTTSVLKSGGPTKEWIEDVFWAALNAREFAFNK